MANDIKLVANNKKAYHDYFIEDKIETGIELFGTEVKSIRMGKCSIKESFVRIEKGEVFLYGMHISPYEKEIFSTKMPCVCGNSCFIRQKSANWVQRLQKKDLPWCRFRCI